LACRPEIGESPSLVDWLSEYELALPSPVSLGDFGPDGAPRALDQAPAEGTVSLPEVGDRSASRPPVGSELEGDGSSGTMFVRPAGATSSPGADRPEPGALSGPAPSRKEGPPRSTTLQILMLLLSLVALAVVLVRVFSPEPGDEVLESASQTATPVSPDALAPEGETPPAPSSEAPVPSADAGTDVGSGLPESGSVALDKPSDESSSEAAGGSPREKTRAQREQVRQERKEARAAARKEKREARAVAAAKEALADRVAGVTKPPRNGEGRTAEGQGKSETNKGARGLLRLGSTPWAEAFVNGRHIGETPITDHSLPVGEHRVLLRCGPCAKPQSKKGKVTISEGQKTKFVAKFKAGRDLKEEQD
ncbi:MAG: hypothetical protein VX498_15445, partial [Myxococcota bacterium]|nr:hypothetical protein [Myxococcota bacterium]